MSCHSINLNGAITDRTFGGAGLDCVTLDRVEEFLKDATKRPRYIRGPDGGLRWHTEPRTSVADFDPAKEDIYEKKMVEGWRDQLHDALLKVGRQAEDVARLTGRVAFLESELKLAERHNTNSLKDITVLKQQLAAKQR